jgi:hypothetical protein
MILNSAQEDLPKELFAAIEGFVPLWMSRELVEVPGECRYIRGLLDLAIISMLVQINYLLMNNV